MPKKLSMDLLSTERWEREPEAWGATAGGLEGYPPPPASEELPTVNPQFTFQPSRLLGTGRS